MKTIINYTINDGIFVKFKDLDRDLRMKLCKYFFFTEKNSYSEKPSTINLVSLVDYCGEKCLKFPSNEQYFKNCIEELGYEVGNITDLRCDKKLEGFKTNIILKSNQATMLDKLQTADFNSVIACGTGWGKSLFILKVAEELQAPILFVANRTALIENFLKDFNKFNASDVIPTQIDSDWLKNNGKVSAINYCTVQALDEDIIEALKDKITLVCLEESHLVLHGLKTREILYSLNPRYRIYLSATPHSLSFEGLTYASLSSNILTDEDSFSKDVYVNHINLIPSGIMKSRYYMDNNYTTKKGAIFKDREYINSISEMVAYMIIKQERKVMIYVEDTLLQETLKARISEYGIKVGCLNTLTNKKESKHLIENFDKGAFSVVIGGSALVQGLSFYSLNTFINLNLKTNANSLKQGKGRLLRLDEDICNKEKHYIQITIKGLNDYKWKEDKKAFEEFDYMKSFPTIEANLEGLELCKIVKNILS